MVLVQISTFGSDPKSGPKKNIRFSFSNFENDEVGKLRLNKLLRPLPAKIRQDPAYPVLDRNVPEVSSGQTGRIVDEFRSKLPQTGELRSMVPP